jgi:hypothetical protein
MPIIMNGHEERPNTDCYARDMAESPLLSALRHLDGSTGASGSSDGSRSEFSSSFEALLEWGEAQRLILPAANFSFFERPADGHGDEHEAWFDEATNTWFKATYPNRFGLGWQGEDSATPKQYFDRLVLQNKYFADRIELVALVSHDGKLRVLTSQPHIAGGPAQYSEIQEWFVGLGFKRIVADGNIAWYHSQENLLIADAHEGNVLRTSDNFLMPIDLNLTHPTGEMRDWAESQSHCPAEFSPPQPIVASP